MTHRENSNRSKSQRITEWHLMDVSTQPRTSGQEPHHQMQFSVIPGILPFFESGGGLLLCNWCMVNISNRPSKLSNLQGILNGVVFLFLVLSYPFAFPRIWTHNCQFYLLPGTTSLVYQASVSLIWQFLWWNYIGSFHVFP